MLTFEATADIVSTFQVPPKKALLSREQFELGDGKIETDRFLCTRKLSLEMCDGDLLKEV